MAALQHEMGWFLSLFREGDGGSTQQAWAPAMDVCETDGEIVYAFDLPGIPEDKISIEFEDGADCRAERPPLTFRAPGRRRSRRPRAGLAGAGAP